MKYAVSTLILLLATPAFAGVRFLNEFNPKLPKVQIATTRSTSPNTVIQPMRMARLKLEISKFTLVDNGNGSTTATSQVVCTKEIDTPVFDLRSVEIGEVDGTHGLTSCPSTLNSQPVNVNLSSQIFLVHGKAFEGEAAADFKYALATVVVPNSNFTNNYYVGGARGIDATSFMGSIAGGIQVTCSSDNNGNSTCSVNSPLESFSATVEFIDQ